MPGRLHLLLLLLWEFLCVFISVESSAGSERYLNLPFVSVEQRLQAASLVDATALSVAVPPPGGAKALRENTELLASNIGLCSQRGGGREVSHSGGGGFGLKSPPHS